MIPEIIIGSSLGSVTGRMINGALDRYSNLGGDVTFDSEANHDGWGWDDWWSAADWIAWHHALIAKYGVDEGERIWVNEFDKSTYGAAEINFAVKNDDFRKFLQQTGLASKSTILSKVYRAENSIDAAIEPVADVYQGVGDVISGTGEALSKTGEGLDNVGTLLKWLPWIALGAAVIFLFFYFRTAKKLVS